MAPVASICDSRASIAESIGICRDSSKPRLPTRTVHSGVDCRRVDAAASVPLPPWSESTHGPNSVARTSCDDARTRMRREILDRRDDEVS